MARRFDAQLGPIQAAVDAAVAELVERDAVARVWKGDHTLWQDDPNEVADRLGWLHSPTEMTQAVDDLATFADDVAADGYTHVVLAGMGGSSLFADVVAQSFPPVAGRPTVHVLDSTDPAAVRRAAALAPTEQVLFVVASKSGTTIETRSHLAHFWDGTGGRGEQFVAVTDPGSPLARLGDERGFRRVFENRPDIGGRYSALSYFGLVPAALAGVDVGAILDAAAITIGECGPDTGVAENPGAWLGAVLGGAARDGRDKLTLLLPPEIDTFGAWVEQLVAESTGKQGRGIVPVVGDAAASVEAYGDDRLFVALGTTPGLDALAEAGHPVVQLPFEDVVDIGAEVFRWELATALAGALLDLNPFDQPDVASAKEATADALQRGVPAEPEEPLEPLLDRVEPGGYLAILAYVDPGAPIVAALERVREALRDRLGVAVTLGIGPRYLHSTGQLHKGGPGTGVFVQVVAGDVEDITIPGQPYAFSVLKRAQAAGDLAALRARGLPAARVDLEELLEQVG